jgi:uncharacterized protein
MNRTGLLLILASAVFLANAAAQNEPVPSLPDLMKQAQAGDAGAQAELGRAYEDGKGVPQSDELAVEWYRKSAEQGNARAENSLGGLYWGGRGVARDREEAVRWYKRAAKLGLAEGAYNVAISYYNGEGVPYDLDLAYAWMLVAQSRGDTQAQEALQRIGAELHGHTELSKLKLANLYENGTELPADLAAASNLEMEVAQEEYKASQYVTGAQFKLCLNYVYGHGVPQDYGEAISWCKKAVEPPRGSGATPLPDAIIALGRMAEQGLGQEKNVQEAAKWYQKAIEERVPTGFMEMARLKSQGGPAAQSDTYYWLYLAKLFDVPAANDECRKVAASLDPREIARQEKKAYKWLKTHYPARAFALRNPGH